MINSYPDMTTLVALLILNLTSASMLGVIGLKIWQGDYTDWWS